MIDCFQIFITIFYVKMNSFTVNVFCNKCTSVMCQGASSNHSTYRSFHFHFSHLAFLNQCQIWHKICNYVSYDDYKHSPPDTAVLLLLSKVTQKHFRQPYRPSKVPLRPAGLFTPVSLPAHIPDFHNTEFLPDTIPLPGSSPFWSAPTCHQLILPDLLRSEILYQAISLMIIIHIFHCYCYILSFPASSLLLLSHV